MCMQPLLVYIQLLIYTHLWCTHHTCTLLLVYTHHRIYTDVGALGGHEWLSIRIAMRVTICSLPNATESSVDVICTELYAILEYLCEPWAPNTTKVLKEFLLSLFEEVLLVYVCNYYVT